MGDLSISPLEIVLWVHLKWLHEKMLNDKEVNMINQMPDGPLSQQGDVWVLIKAIRWKRGSSLWWDGPFQVRLTTPTAVRDHPGSTCHTVRSRYQLTSSSAGWEAESDPDRCPGSGSAVAGRNITNICWILEDLADTRVTADPADWKRSWLKSNESNDFTEQMMMMMMMKPKCETV